ncbi:MAG: hypothetical protein KJ600_06325 [Nanoarchaeota archaeon]|nr:hypothetical protein [Nanoarchaeota archaeon]MBU1104141.1 hypothetical protein [Nanoarchaeota archaeon]
MKWNNGATAGLFVGLIIGVLFFFKFMVPGTTTENTYDFLLQWLGLLLCTL